MTIKTYGSRYERFRGNFSNFAAKQPLTMEQKFGKNSIDIEALRSITAEHLLSQARACYLDLHRATARERYELLLQRCPGIVEHLDLQDLASFLCITPNYLSTIRKSITFESKK